MCTDIAEGHTPKRARFAPSLETVCLICAGCLAVCALVISLLPDETIAWMLARLG
jgi:hypothetical protein